jgi:alpha-L-rhamnosidase
MVTPLFAASARILSELSTIAGQPVEARKYAELFEKVRTAYLEGFVDPASGKVGPGTQASQAFALYLDLVPAERRAAVLQYLLDDIRLRQDGHLSTGIFGTKFLLDTLSREGHAEVASGIVKQKTFPGWGYMLENGATTLWEHWKGSDNTYSHNHPMFGSVSEWFYHWLGGIQPAPDAVGFDRIVIRPQMVKDLDWVRCSYRSARGMIISNWKRRGNRLQLDIEIPANASALVFLPAMEATQVKEGGKPVLRSEGIRFIRQEGNQVLLQVASGRYSFETPSPLLTAKGSEK